MPCNDCSRTETCPPCPDEEPEPPLTPEEEEEACETGDMRTCTMACPVHGEPKATEDEEPFPAALRAAGVDPEDIPVAAPPQPERRPPLLVAYSVQGHLYEVALPGDAAVRAVDGALVVTHPLGPVAGICQVAPYVSEEQA
jgi:hypothetical protein